ncbi:MAG TPA: VWA domain-containing protein [Pirellulaceae bacterium]|nr:VWA domain-containing protein [Pirellulaceae bacterium]
MSGLEIGFDQPWYLALLSLIPVLWIFSFRSLAGLGNIRRLVAIGLRTLVLTTIVFALAEVQLLQTSDKVTVNYVLDQSESIPLVKRQAMLDFVVKAVHNHRGKERGDLAGVVVFGRNATIEIPPFDDDILVLGGLESHVNLRSDATNLSAALKLAQASFAEGSSKRIVIVTDGNENLGDARAIAASLAEDGIGIDVVPVKLTMRSEVAVERVMMPANIRRGQPMETRVVLNNFSDETIAGRVTFRRKAGLHDEFLGEIDVELSPGKKVLSFADKIDNPGTYTYQADFVPTDPQDDLMSQNNRATAFTHVRGKGSVLLIEDWQNPGEFDYMIDRLRASDIEVDVMASDSLFTRMGELQAYDSVILANVPRSSGDDAQSVASFSDQQIKMLVKNTEEMGCGLLMLGGRNSFGVGGWSNTELEKAMPVDFQIKNAKIRAVGAVAMMMHASELAEGNHWQKKVAEKAINALGPMDYCGLIHWDGDDHWLWGEPQGIIQVGNRRNMMLARLGRMQPGDMPEFEPGMKRMLVSFQRVNASVKLMIVISDGDPSPPLDSTLRRYKQAGIQVTTVAVGTHGPAGHKTLQKVANITGGRYYVVKDPRALPKIYVSEVRRVARPLIFEPESPVQPQITYPHEILQGIQGNLPPISGFVMTTLKENPLVEVAAISPLPTDEKNSTILASWTYGLGRTAVLTTDAGHRWARWTDWENYDKFFSQLVRWSMRPVNDMGKFSVATVVKDGKVRAVITALDKNDDFLNFLNMAGTATSPDLESLDIKFEQVAPGRYVGEFDSDKDGNYFLTVSPGPGYAPLRAGVNVPYSSEFRDRETNMALLNDLARRKPKDGKVGVLIDGDLDANDFGSLLSVNSFRSDLAPAVDSQDVWPLFLVLTSCLFFADIFVRRVTINFDWVAPTVVWLRNKVWRIQVEQKVEEVLDRLRSSKAEVADQIDDRRAATRFEPVPDDMDVASAKTLEEVLEDTSPLSGRPGSEKRPTTQMTPDAADEESYTTRLLKAKKQAWKDHQE